MEGSSPCLWPSMRGWLPRSRMLGGHCGTSEARLRCDKTARLARSSRVFWLPRGVLLCGFERGSPTELKTLFCLGRPASELQDLSAGLHPCPPPNTQGPNYRTGHHRGFTMGRPELRSSVSPLPRSHRPPPPPTVFCQPKPLLPISFPLSVSKVGDGDGGGEPGTSCADGH